MSDEPDLTRVNENFGGNVRARREALGWSQSELARRMNDAGWPKYSQITVARTEDSTRGTRLDEALALTYVLGTDMPSMLEPSGHAAAVGKLRAALQDARAAGDAVGNAVYNYDFQQSVLSRELEEVQEYAQANRDKLGRREARALEKLIEDAGTQLRRPYPQAVNDFLDEIHGAQESEDAGDYYAHMQAEIERGK
ncbi:helix-turn-helix domain-containing protein [Kocuria sp. U4B]